MPVRRARSLVMTGLSMALLAALLVAGTATLSPARPAAAGPATPVEPWTKAGSIDWNAGWWAANGYTGNFARAQSMMAELANLVYEDDFAEQIEPSGFEVTKTIDRVSLDASAGRSTNGAMNFIAIRGTTVKDLDLLADLLQVPVFTQDINGHEITTHEGFMLQGSTAAGELRDAVSSSCEGEPGQPKTPLWLTGHSLGAADASIAAMILAQTGCYVAGVSLFGSPRPGLHDFADAYRATIVETVSLQDRTQRWVNNNDPIYCTPLGGAWSHVGVENLIDKDGGIHLGTNETDSSCNTPETTLGKFKLGLNIATLGTLDLPQQMINALLDWLNGLVDLVFQCDSSDWSQVWSLGACGLVDVTGRLVQFYNISPLDLLTEIIRIGFIANHKMDNYEGRLAADWSDGIQWVNLHVVIDMPAEKAGEVYLYDDTTTQFCVPSPDAAGQLSCDFQAPVGSWMFLHIDGYMMGQMHENQTLFDDGCNDWEPNLANDTLYPPCNVFIEGDQQVTFYEGVIPI